MDVVVDAAVKDFDCKDLSVDVSWRGDGQLVAVLIGDPMKRTLSIFDGATLRLSAVAQAECPLTGCIAWQPNGRHLYAGASVQDTSIMCLFEPNGLGHGSFSLRNQGACLLCCVNLHRHFSQGA